MSNLQVPGTPPPTSSATSGPGLPGGSLNQASPQNAEMKLMQLFGQSLKEWGEAVLKQDGAAVSNAQRKVQQVVEARQAQGTTQDRPAAVQPRTGVPTPVDGRHDATTGR